MMMKKPNHLLFALKATQENMYKSNLDDQEKILLESLLMVLKINDLLENPGNPLESDYKQIIPELIEKSQNPELIDLFSKYFGPIVSKTRKKYLSQLVSFYLNLEDHWEHPLVDYFDEQLDSYFGHHGRHSGDALQPKELTELMNFFLPKGEKIKYYNPFAGLGSLALSLPKNTHYRGEEINQSTWLLAKLRMLAYDCPADFHLKNSDTFSEWATNKEDTYDFIAFNPPFNLRLVDTAAPHFKENEFWNQRNANSLIISEAFKRLNAKGKMVFVVPGGFLGSSVKTEKNLKKYLVDQNYLATIIAFPDKLLSFTSIPINLIVLEKNRSEEKVKFIDASSFYKGSQKQKQIDLARVYKAINEEGENENFRKITPSEIAANSYVLNVNRYVVEEIDLPEIELENLTPLSRILRTIALKRLTTEKGQMITFSDLSNDPLRPNLDTQNLKAIEDSKRLHRIDKKGLLISTIGNHLKSTLVDPKGLEIFIGSSSILFFEIIDEQVLPEYLVLEMHKDYFKNYVRSIQLGTIMRFRREDFLKLKIVLPSFEDQKRIVSQALYEAVNVAQEPHSGYNVDIADQDSFLRHQIAGSLRNVRTSFRFLKQTLEEKVQPLVPDLFFLKHTEQLPSTLQDYLNRMERDLLSITKAVNRAGTEIELSDLQIEKIDLLAFVKNYAEELNASNGGRYGVEIDTDPSALKESRIKTIYINGDKELLRKMFDNIIENADKHAFERKINPSNRIKFEFLYTFEDSEVQLDISNTGKPLPENYEHESFTRKGSSSGEFAGDGTGGWFINEVMKLHSGNFGFTDETGPEGTQGDFVTSIELTFPIEIN